MATLLKSSYFSGKNGDKFQLNLYFEVTSQSIADNTSKIEYSLYWKSISGYSGSGSTVTGYINNSSVGTATSISANENKLMGTKTVTITHEDDGTFPDTSYSAKIDTPWALGDASVEGTLTSSNVDTIPRKSSVSCTNGNIESAVTITITRKSSSFTHTLRYDFGSLTNKTIVSKTTKTSYSWTLPTTFYAQIPNATSGKVTLYCDTYNGSDLVGTSSTTFTAKTTESKCKPTVSATIVDSNDLTIGLTGNSNNLVKNVSNALVTTTATAKNSASISSIKVTCDDGKSGTGASVTLKKVTSGDFTITAKDSRGYSTSTSVSKTLVDYVPLTLNYNFYRPEPTTGEIVMSVSGKYFNGSFGTVGNHLTVQYRYKESGGTYPEEYTTVTVNVTTSNTYSLELSLGTDFDYQKSYDFEIVAYDKITEGSPINKTQHVTEGIPMLGLFKEYIEAFGHTLVETSDKGNALHTGVDAYLPDGYYGLDMHNSDIVHANGIYFNDELSGREGVAFLKQGGDNTNTDDYEYLQGRRGVLYYDDDAVLDVGNYLDYTHPVGSVIITSTNTNPSGTLGGTWKLYNRHMSGLNVSESNENSIFTPVSSVISDYTVTIIRTETSLRIRLNVTTASALTDSNITLGTFDFTKVGVTSLYYTMEQLPMMFDGGDSVVNVTLGYTGTLTSKDVITRGSDSASLAVGSTGYLNVDVSIPSTNRGLNACGEFHWKRTA